MVLAELGSKITQALSTLGNSAQIDQAALDAVMSDICRALLEADVNVKLVLALRNNVKAKVNLEEVGAGLNKKRLIQMTVFEELCALMDPGVKAPQPVKGKQNVIMFCGLQGAGKTTTVTKMAYHYKKKGWKSALVCADTFRAGAFDQLKQNAAKVKIPFYGSYTETDPVQVARDGVEAFKREKYEVIIVDTSGRHAQEVELFEEMRQIAAAVKPDSVVFVMDSTIGQAAYDQASAFKASVDVGSIVITKMDSHAKGGGALSAVAATKSPVVFIGTGEHMDDFEPFVTRVFVQKLLGMGDLGGLMDKLKEAVPNLNDQKDMAERVFKEGIFTLRDMYDQFQNLLKMGPINKVMEMIPGMSQMLKSVPSGIADNGSRLKMYMTVMDSMTEAELDDNKLLAGKTAPSRIMRIARGSGRSVREVQELLAQFGQFEKMMKKMKNLKLPQNGKMNQKQLSQMSNIIPPHLVKSMGGMSQIQNMMKQMGGNMDMAKMMAGLGGDE